MKLIHPLLGLVPPPGIGTPVREGGVTGKVGYFGMTRVTEAGAPKEHKGIDWLCPVGWPVFAAHAGKVLASGWENPADHEQGYGLRIRVGNGHGDGFEETRYGHLSRLLVVEGQEVEAGQVIGATGKSGNARAEHIPAHLHFEVRKPSPVDPLEWV